MRTTIILKRGSTILCEEGQAHPTLSLSEVMGKARARALWLCEAFAQNEPDHIAITIDCDIRVGEL